MTLRRLTILTATLALCLAVADGATNVEKPPYDTYDGNSLSFSSLKLGLANRVNAVQADGANRVWAATDKGVAAVLVKQLAPFFPLTKASDGLRGDNVTAVAFGNLGGEENFFLGFGTEGATGIQYGRVLSDTGLQPKPPAFLERKQTGDPNGVNLINGLSTNGDRLWAATQGGLVEWVLGGDTPSPGTILLKESPVEHVATDPWAATDAPTVYSSGGDLFAVPAEGHFDSLGTSYAVISLAFDGARTLWVAAVRSGSVYELYRYPYTGDPAHPYDASNNRGGPFALGGTRQIRSIAADPLNPAGTVIWVGTDVGAFFQVVDPATGGLTADWTQATTGAADQNVKVYVDPSGNLWFGSNFGVRSLLSRLVTINSTRFVGYGATATIDLLDVNPNAPGPAPETPPETLTVDIVKQGSDTPELTLTAKKVPGTASSYRATFTFAETTGPGKLGVTSSTENVVFEVLYRFGPDLSRELPRPSFSWANIVKFEDDALIGGPCFLNTLGR